uniref:Uncharacterized protein n=1 Tax=Rhizophora mucronata TaxID=61149 RepID=A0A2P2QB11_RHIMU
MMPQNSVSCTGSKYVIIEVFSDYHSMQVHIPIDKHFLKFSGN